MTLKQIEKQANVTIVRGWILDGPGPARYGYARWHPCKQEWLGRTLEVAAKVGIFDEEEQISRSQEVRRMKRVFLYDADGNVCSVRRPMGFGRSLEIEPLPPSEVALENVAGTLQVRTPEWWEATDERLRARR